MGCTASRPGSAHADANAPPPPPSAAAAAARQDAATAQLPATRNPFDPPPASRSVPPINESAGVGGRCPAVAAPPRSAIPRVDSNVTCEANRVVEDPSSHSQRHAKPIPLCFSEAGEAQTEARWPPCTSSDTAIPSAAGRSTLSLPSTSQQQRQQQGHVPHEGRAGDIFAEAGPLGAMALPLPSNACRSSSCCSCCSATRAPRLLGTKPDLASVTSDDLPDGDGVVVPSSRSRQAPTRLQAIVSSCSSSASDAREAVSVQQQDHYYLHHHDADTDNSDCSHVPRCVQFGGVSEISITREEDAQIRDALRFNRAYRHDLDDTDHGAGTKGALRHPHHQGDGEEEAASGAWGVAMYAPSACRATGSAAVDALRVSPFGRAVGGDQLGSDATSSQASASAPLSLDSTNVLSLEELNEVMTSIRGR